MAEGMSPDGGPAMYITLNNLGPYFSSLNFLTNMITGYVFKLHQRRWIRTGLTCTQTQTLAENLGKKIKEASNTYWDRLITNNETRLQRVTNENIRSNTNTDRVTETTSQLVMTPQLPLLSRIHNPELYMIHEEPMPLRIRKIYTWDRMRNAHTYIMEYSSTKEMEKEKQYVRDQLWNRLQIIYGHVDAVRRKIDASLAKHDQSQKSISISRSD